MEDALAQMNRYHRTARAEWKEELNSSGGELAELMERGDCCVRVERESVLCLCESCGGGGKGGVAGGGDLRGIESLPDKSGCVATSPAITNSATDT